MMDRRESFFLTPGSWLPEDEALNVVKKEEEGI
jgi:hypothetical protein